MFGRDPRGLKWGRVPPPLRLAAGQSVLRDREILCDRDGHVCFFPLWVGGCCSSAWFRSRVLLQSRRPKGKNKTAHGTKRESGGHSGTRTGAWRVACACVARASRLLRTPTRLCLCGGDATEPGDANVRPGESHLLCLTGARLRNRIARRSRRKPGRARPGARGARRGPKADGPSRAFCRRPRRARAPSAASGARTVAREKPGDRSSLRPAEPYPHPQQVPGVSSL